MSRLSSILLFGVSVAFLIVSVFARWTRFFGIDTAFANSGYALSLGDLMTEELCRSGEIQRRFDDLVEGLLSHNPSQGELQVALHEMDRISKQVVQNSAGRQSAVIETVRLQLKMDLSRAVSRNEIENVYALMAANQCNHDIELKIRTILQ